MKPICEINIYGNKHWILNGKLHREDGPAIEWHDGSKAWYINGELHREDGPSIEFYNGYKDWHYHGKKIDCKDNQEFLRMVKLMAFL
tara:strand:- start:284 stop:544 length:261 start_codon:yes stop_codon:yes gene_type:complete